MLCTKSLIQELVWNNLRRGAVQTQEEVRQLLCVLTRDNPNATEQICCLLMNRIDLILKGHLNNYDLGASVRHEIALVAALVQKKDECWELKLRYLMRLFLEACENSKSSTVMESIILPCLKIMLGLLKSTDSNGKKGKEKVNATISRSVFNVHIDIYMWLERNAQESFAKWKSQVMRRNGGAVALQSDRANVSVFYFCNVM